MNNDDRRLPKELVWEGTHLSELALTAIADGQQEIVEANAAAHAEACDFCAGRMARAALLSAAIGLAVVTVTPAQVKVADVARVTARSSPQPWKPLLLGVAVAALAAIPTLPHLMTTVLDLIAYGRIFSSHGIPVLVRGGIDLATSEAASRALSIATPVSSVLLLMMGWAIARTRSGETSERSMS